jgi:putative IMPACT (imprinted ancient) family translation regulator
MSQKRKRSQEPEQDTPNVYRSAPIEDRSSKFIGYFSPSLKPKELQKLGEIESASHKILASRRESNQQAITGGTKYTTDHDDDGEKYAGKTVAKMLNNMQVVGACVVARWYGGVLLGPVRFEHIQTCAREAIQKWKESVAEEHAKKRKLEQDEADIKRLVGILAERDQSILVLRQLASEKEGKLKTALAVTKETNGAVDGDTEPKAVSVKDQQPTNGKPAIDYSTMPLDRLKALEKARDATLSFLLKRIDKAELELVGATGQLPET